MGALDKIANAKFLPKGRYPNFGKYLFEVNDIRIKEDGYKGDSAISEFTILEATKTHDSENPSPVNSTVDYVENLSDPKKGGGDRFKGYLMNLVGATNEELANPSTLKKFVDERKAGVKLKIRAEVYPKKIGGKNGKPEMVISGYRWEHVELTDDEIKSIDAKRVALKLPPLAEALKD